MAHSVGERLGLCLLGGDMLGIMVFSMVGCRNFGHFLAEVRFL